MLQDKSDGDSGYRKDMSPCIFCFESTRIYSKTIIEIDLLYVSISLRQPVQCIDVIKYLVVACFHMKWGKAECLFLLEDFLFLNMVQVSWQDFDKAMALVVQFCHRPVMFADPKPYHVYIFLLGLHHLA